MKRWHGVGVALFASVGLFAGAAASPAVPAGSPSAATRAGSAPATRAAVLPGWAPGLDEPVAGVTPLCMNLWNGEAPHQVSGAKPEYDNGTGRIWSVNVPGVLVYLPPKEKLAASGGTCIVYCPGGGYTHLTRLSGADGAVELMMPRGIAVVSLKYRLTPPSTDPERDAVLDGCRAIRLVRAHAKEWGIDPHKVGIMGASAGGNLILSLCTHLEAGGKGDGAASPSASPPPGSDPVERESCRPDFAVMWSPWPNKKTIDAYRAGKEVPPALIGSAEDDKTAPYAFARAVEAEWKQVGVPVEFISVPTGGHGAFELGKGTAKDWPEKLWPWLRRGGWWKDVE